MTAPGHLGRRRVVQIVAIVLVIGLGWLIWSQTRTTKPKPDPVAADPSTVEEPGAASEPFEDEPAARALYDQMVETMRKADSLSFVAHYRWETKDRVFGDCTYRAWLKKPNYFRVEVKATVGDEGGTLVGDGDDLWIFWPRGRYRFAFDPPEFNEDVDLTSLIFDTYVTKRTPLAQHSIGHEVVYLGGGMFMPIIDPSTFHGYTDSLQPYLDGVRSLGVEKVDDEECDKIEVSIMKGQRVWVLWLSKRDHLPRKLRQVVRASNDLLMSEEWSSVTLNAEIADTMFAWTPPEEWREWRPPGGEERLLKPGSTAPDFELASTDGKQIKLSDYRGQVVWLYAWRAG